MSEVLGVAGLNGGDRENILIYRIDESGRCMSIKAYVEVHCRIYLLIVNLDISRCSCGSLYRIKLLD